MAIIKRQMIRNGEDLEKETSSYFAGGNAKSWCHFGKQFCSFFKS